MTQLRELIERVVVAERRTALTAPEGKNVADTCGRNSASGRAPPQEVIVGIPRPYPTVRAGRKARRITGGEPP